MRQPQRRELPCERGRPLPRRDRTLPAQGLPHGETGGLGVRDARLDARQRRIAVLALRQLHGQLRSPRDELRERPPVLAREPRIEIAPRFDRLQPLGIGFEAAEIAAERAGRLLGGDHGLVELGERVGERRIQRRRLLDGVAGGAGRHDGGVLAIREPLQRERSQLAQPVGMREPRRLGLELRLLALAQPGLVQLGGGGREVLAALGERGERVAQPGQLVLGLAQRGQGLGELRALRLEPGQPVERRQGRALAEQALVLVLAMEVQEQLAQALQIRQRDARLVHARAAPALCRHLAPDDQRLAVELEAPLLEQGRGAAPALAREAELRLDHAGLRALAHDVGIGATADDEGQGLHRERLARPGLAGDRGEPAAELHLGALDEGQVADGQAFEHGVLPVRGGRVNLASWGRAWSTPPAGESVCTTPRGRR